MNPIEPSEDCKSLETVKIDFISANQLTIWQLGSLEHRVLPTAQAIDRLRQKIEELDLPGKHLIWGPELKVITMSFDE